MRAAPPLRARRSGRIRGLAAASAAILLGACTGDNVLLPPQPPTRPASSSFTYNRINDREHQRLLTLFGGEYKAPQTKAALDSLVAQLIRANDLSTQTFDLTLLNSPVPNAFALPNGQIYLTRGLVALINDTAEAAAVISHEMAHVTARHANGRVEQQQRANLTRRVSAEVLKDENGAATVEERSRALLASFSRQQELEADRIGVRLLAKAGFDPYGASRFLSTLGRSTALRQAAAEGPSRPDMLATHPSTQERIGQTLSAARQIGAPGIGQRDRATWLSVIDGIGFGGDPKKGAANGRKYVNSALGITFQAPDGMALDAGTDAVLGQSRGGALALRFEGVRLDAGQTLDTYVGSGWIEGMTTSNVQRLSVDGRPAVTAEGRGKDWSFRLAAVQVDDRTYRFILAGRGDEDLDGPFRTLITSFRKLGAGDSSGLRSLRIRTVTAPAGATPEIMAQQMADIDQRLEQFLVLNGLDRGSALTPGQRYKIVSE